ncbi:hypothetical protein ASE00_09975 [Sphingomonas sp. Root710]|uniref:hypothetical protein n=1 Tax=Sphingomonas sp. Root710 TaxID=1736594 RepID=UPI0006FEA196|nr:hypothetical protein [Sphingomonas sp. Root710]KRB82386.1 hypothetical protein ASE00_09975 [Sphingomonas sp. Root710]
MFGIEARVADRQAGDRCGREIADRIPSAVNRKRTSSPRHSIWPRPLRLGSLPGSSPPLRSRN